MERLGQLIETARCPVSRLHWVQPIAAHLPESLLAALLHAPVKPVVALRCVVLLALLWREGGQTRAALIAGTERRLGRGSFGPAGRAFRRDIGVVRAVLAGQGYRLVYHRRGENRGYAIEGRAGLAPEILRAIRGAAEELDPRQIEIFSRLSPAQRLQIAARLSDDLLSMAVHRLQREQPELTRLQAQREVLRHLYVLQE